MKRWTRICIIVISLFLIATVVLIASISKKADKEGKEYLVEINRIVSNVNSSEKTINNEKIVLDSIEKIEYNKAVKSMFYYCGNDDTKINKIINGDVADNEEYVVKRVDDVYLLFIYEVNDSAYKNSFVISFILYSVFVVLFILLIYLYVRNSILKPFNQLQEMPLELAKGNLDLNIKDNKNKHFGKFIWGLNMLKDNMYTNRKKEYELQKEKKMIILTISHDVKTPLSAINLYANAMEEDSSKAVEYSGKIKKNIEIINNFVEDIVKYSKEDIINIDIHNEEFYLLDLMKKVNVQYKEKMDLMQARLEIIDCPNPLLYGDKNRLYEAITNILENALKYGDRKKICISFYSEDNCEIIKISNSGSDIPNTEINHVFESFFRGKNAIGKEGNGLGLYIAREILRKMDGEIFISKDKDLLNFNLVVRKA